MRLIHLILIFCLLVLASCTKKPEPPVPPSKPDLNQRDSYGLELRPFLALNLRFHTDSIMRMATDAGENFLVTVSLDKTAKVWSLPDIELIKTIYPSTGTGNEGTLYSVAVSPDGSTIAIGGWLTTNGTDINIYLFDANSGMLTGIIGGLEDIPTHLCYSHQGKYLAAVLNNSNGMRAWDMTNNNQLIVSDGDYEGSSYFCQFSRDGRLITSSYDGYIRIYDNKLRLQIKKQGLSGKKPFFTPLSPDGKFTAVGYTDSPQVDILTGNLLDYRYTIKSKQLSLEGFNQLAWSQDSQFLFGGGEYKNSAGGHPIRIWFKRGLGGIREISNSIDTIMGITVLRNRDFIVSTQEPALFAVNAKGEVIRQINSEAPDFNMSLNMLGVSADGSEIAYQYRNAGKYYKARFDAVNYKLTGDLPGNNDGYIQLPKSSTNTLNVRKGNPPTIIFINKFSVGLDDNDRLRCFAVNDEGTRVFTGNEYTIRVFNKSGLEELKIPVKSSVNQINVSQNGRWIVAAHTDGTIRWYNAETGNHQLTYFMNATNNEWVLFTPDNEYMTSENGTDLVLWRENIEDRFMSTDLPESTYKKEYYNPDLIKQIFY